jgi:hypothetical protein
MNAVFWNITKYIRILKLSFEIVNRQQISWNRKSELFIFFQLKKFVE